MRDRTVDVGGLASEVVRLRRMAGLGTAELAHRAGVGQVDLALVEAGEPVPEGTARDVCAALHLPMWRHLAGAPHGLVMPVEVIDEAHARDQTALASAVRDEWLAVPDVAAHDRGRGWAPGRRRRLARLDPWAKAASEVGLILLVGAAGLSVMSVIMGFLSVLVDLSRGSPRLWEGAVMLCAGLAGFAVLCLARRAWKGSSTKRAFEDVVAAAPRGGLLRRGHAFSEEGLGVLEVGPQGVTRTDFPLRDMTGVRICDEDDDHVSVVVRTRTREIACRWLPRCRDVSDVCDAWIAEIAARRPAGQPYVVVPPSATAGLEGPQ